MNFTTGTEDYLVNSSFITIPPTGELNLVYTACEILVAILAVIGNAMVIFVFRKERRLRRRTNYYIVSLAAADFLVGLLGIPFAIMASVGIPSNLYACLFTVSLLVVLCTISIFCLVAVSVDRYWAILHPMGYSRNVRTRTALVIIGICWFAGSIIGFLPLMGWYNGDSEMNQECYFLKVVDMNYLVFLYFGTIITPALVLAAFYAHIYRVVLKQLRQIVTISPTHSGTSSSRSSSGGTMLRMLGAAQKREVKATQNLSIIVLFFMICWIPLYTINCVIAFCSQCQINETFMYMCIILSHANSAGNPILYAYHLKDFREALKNFLLSIMGRSPAPSTNRTSIVSNLNHCGLYNKHYSLRDSRLVHTQNRRYMESPIYMNRTTKSMSLPSPPKVIASIVPTSVNLATAAGVEKRDIWRISEAATGEDPSHSHNDSSDSHTRQSSPLNKNPSSSSSAKNCSSYLNEANYYDEDDDVFLDDTLPITDANVLPTITKDNNKCEDVVLNKINNQHNVCISTSSPQLSQNLFLVENELKDIEKRDCKTISIFNAKENGKVNVKKRFKLSLSCDVSSPTKNSKLSPFKAVSGFLWNTGKNARSRSLSDDSNASNQSKKNGLIQVNDNHSFDY